MEKWRIKKSGRLFKGNGMIIIFKGVFKDIEYVVEVDGRTQARVWKNLHKLIKHRIKWEIVEIIKAKHGSRDRVIEPGSHSTESISGAVERGSS